jgi:hypothetical protein
MSLILMHCEAVYCKGCNGIRARSPVGSFVVSAKLLFTISHRLNKMFLDCTSKLVLAVNGNRLFTHMNQPTLRMDIIESQQQLS